MRLHRRCGRPPPLYSRTTLLLLGIAATTLCLLGTVVQAIYPDGHFEYVTKITNVDHLNQVVDENINAGKTLFVRWIASSG